MLTSAHHVTSITGDPRYRNMMGNLYSERSRSASPATIATRTQSHTASAGRSRTLAWFIRRHPRGLVAGAIQYGHVHTRLIQGYAGDYNSGFPDEYAFEDFLARLDELAADERALAAGEHVSGPAADTYRSRIGAATAQFAGHVLTTGKQARDLLGNPLLQIFHGEGMTCVFEPARALCQIQGDASDPMVTPEIDDCRPRCRNIAHTDRDVVTIRARRDELKEIVNDTLAPPIRRHREQQELNRLNILLEKHQ
jgi:hypothetical protein